MKTPNELYEIYDHAILKSSWRRGTDYIHKTEYNKLERVFLKTAKWDTHPLYGKYISEFFYCNVNDFINLDIINKGGIPDLKSDYIESFKPILRPIKTITEGDIEQLLLIVENNNPILNYFIENDFNIHSKEFKEVVIPFIKNVKLNFKFVDRCLHGAICQGIYWEYSLELMRFFNEKLIDIDGMIKKGLAYDEDTVKLMGL